MVNGSCKRCNSIIIDSIINRVPELVQVCLTNSYFKIHDENDILARIYLVYKGQEFGIEVKQPHDINFEEDDGFAVYLPFYSPIRELNYNEFFDKCKEFYRKEIVENGNRRRVIFTRLIQDIHTHNASYENENIMISEITLRYKSQNFILKIQQPYGVNFEDTEGVELIIPEAATLLKELNYDDLSDKCEDYYRDTTRGISGNNIRMRNNLFVREWVVGISLAEENGTTW